MRAVVTRHAAGEEVADPLADERRQRHEHVARVRVADERDAAEVRDAVLAPCSTLFHGGEEATRERAERGRIAVVPAYLFRTSRRARPHTARAHRESAVPSHGGRSRTATRRATRRRSGAPCRRWPRGRRPAPAPSCGDARRPRAASRRARRSRRTLRRRRSSTARGGRSGRGARAPSARRSTARGRARRGSPSRGGSRWRRARAPTPRRGRSRRTRRAALSPRCGPGEPRAGSSWQRLALLSRGQRPR